IIRTAVFLRVSTSASASLLDRAAAVRNSMSRGSFSKYSTRHGAQSVSISFFGNSSIDFSGARESKMPLGKVEHFAPLMGQQNVIGTLEISSLWRFKPAG